MAYRGQELTDPDTHARLRFLETAESSKGEAVTVALEVREGWSAGPLHVHPAQRERLRVDAGVFHVRSGDEQRVLRAGDEIDVARGTPHTVRLMGSAGAIVAEFAPALRTEELFEIMFSGRWPRRPPSFVPSAIRAWVESRGFAGEIRYLWPRRAVTLIAAAAALRLARNLRRRRLNAGASEA